MLKKRIIPCLDVKNGRVVKGVNFVNLIDAGDPVEQAKFYSEEGADEVCFLDISASLEKRKTMMNIVSKTAEKVFIPLTVGGGINEVKDILLKERKPTKTSVKLFNQVDNMNVNHKKMECDQVNTRQTPNYGRVHNGHNQIPNTNNLNNTRDRFMYNNDNRINPDILSPLKNNPYAKPLNVF